MSDENKNLGDKAGDAMDNAKKKADQLGDKAKAGFDKAKDSAKAASDNAKDKTKDFSDNAKEAANDFKENVKNTFDPDQEGSGKTVAIIAHITFIGWIIAIIMNGQNKTEFGSFYIRQLLGLWLFGIVIGLIPIIGCFAGILILVLVIMSVINAANGKMVKTPVVGDYFQEWFRSL